MGDNSPTPLPIIPTPNLTPGISISPPLIPLSLEARGGGGHHPCPAVISRSPLVQQVVKSGAFKTVKAFCFNNGLTYLFNGFALNILSILPTPPHPLSLPDWKPPFLPTPLWKPPFYPAAPARCFVGGFLPRPTFHPSTIIGRGG